MRRTLATVGALLWSASVWWASSLPPSKIPVKFDWLQGFGPTVWNLGHFGVFGILGLLVGAACDAQGRCAGLRSKAGQVALFLVTLYALTDEMHQWSVPKRSCSVADVVVDTMGALFMLSWPYFPFASANNRPRTGRLAWTALGIGVVLSYLGATVDIPGDALLATTLTACFGHR